MAFGEIADVYCVSGEPGAEAFGLRSTNAEIPEIILSADYIRDYNLVPLLEKVKSLSHAMFEDTVKRYMEATDTSPGYS